IDLGIGRASGASYLATRALYCTNADYSQKAYELINYLDGTTPDGDYLMVANLYANDYETLGLDTDVPLTFTYAQEYFGADSNGSITIPGAFNTDNAAGGSYPIATVTKAGTSYTITPF
ncbi:MAG: hypothetical protein ACPGRW_01090, partial [Flavobacteriaceae bacterium]